jgi:plastocyanin
MNTTRHRALASLAATFLLAVAVAACSDDQPGAAAGTTQDQSGGTAIPVDAGPTAETIAVTAVDYAFEGLPDVIGAGSTLTLTNEGAEPHELVALRIPDDEDRSVSELLALPQEELFAVFGGDAEPATVILAGPGQTDVPGAVVGDGTLTEPGRYAIICFIPVGSDPSALDPEAEGPPQSDSPPHAARGMWAEVTVQ